MPLVRAYWQGSLWQREATHIGVKQGFGILASDSIFVKVSFEHNSGVCEKDLRTRNILCWKGKMDQSKCEIVRGLAATYYRRGRNVGSLILNFGTIWRCVVNESVVLIPRKGATDIHRAGGWVVPTAGLYVLEKKKNPCRKSNDFSVFQPVPNTNTDIYVPY